MLADGDHTHTQLTGVRDPF